MPKDPRWHRGASSEEIHLELAGFRVELWEIRFDDGHGWWSGSVLRIESKRESLFGLEYLKDEQIALRMARAVLQELTEEQR